jgi:predicted short-subunit dehydrogenase-like oxidoreductase (DUF2520 family)
LLLSRRPLLRLCFSHDRYQSGLERGVSDTAVPESPLRIVLIGAGRVGPAVAALLQDAGHEIAGVASRSQDSAAAASERLGAPVFDVDGDVPDATVALIAVPDSAIAEIGPRIGARLPAGAILCHFAGSFGIDVWASLSERHGLCALHPVQACPTVDLAIARLPGSAWGVTGTSGLRPWIRSLIARDLRGIAIDVAEEHRALWHAAAVTTANGTTALLASAEAMLRSIGIERPLEVLGPLAAGGVENATAAHDALSVLTGPAIRGDVATIRRHLDALSRHAPELRDAYRLASRITIDAARRGGRLDEVDGELRGVLEMP